MNFEKILADEININKQNNDDEREKMLLGKK